MMPWHHLFFLFIPISNYLYINVYNMSDYVENKSLNVLRGGIKKEKPSAEEISQGQLAVNYRKGYETIFTKNSEDRIVEFEGGEGGNDFIIYRDSNHDEDGIFPDKQALYDSLRDHIESGELLFEPEEGKMCVAFVQGDSGIETYPIISPEPSHDSIVDPEKTKKADEVKVGKKPYGGNKIVVRRHIKQKPWVGLPYYFQDGICVFRENFEYKGAKFVFKYDSNFIHFENVKAYISVEAYFDIEIEDISEGLCDKQLTVTMNAGGHHWAMIRFHMNGYNVFEARNRICQSPHVFILDEGHVKLANISDGKYRTRETLSPYLKLEWANYISGGNDYGSPNNRETFKPKLINIRPSLWRGCIDNLEEKIYPNRETEKYNSFINNIFGRGGLYPRPRYTIKSKIRNNIPIYSQSDYRRANMPCLYPEISGGKLIIHYMAWMIDAHQIDLSDEYLHVSLKNKLTGFGSGSVSFKIYLNQLDLSKNYTEFEATDFPQLANIENVFYCYEINYDFTRCCHGDYYYPSEYFGTTSQFCPRRTNRFAHKLSRWNWCKDGEEAKIVNGEGRYRENKSYSLLLYKKHRGVISKYPCHLSVIRTKKVEVIDNADYLTFDIISGGTIAWVCNGIEEEMIYPNRDLYYRISSDGGNTYGGWNLLHSVDNETFEVNDGDKVQFKGNWESEHTGQEDGNGESKFGMHSTAIVNISGNILSCVQEENFEDAVFTQNYMFYHLFSNLNVVDASRLKLPDYATDFCYEDMFMACTLLTNGPELPATTLAIKCYSGMFWGCTSLTTSPELPATTLADYCYDHMFYGCSSLTTAPDLPATVLTENCYMYMFRNCTNLNYIKCLATDISADYSTEYWLHNVASTGTFIKSPDMNDWTTGTSGIPEGWSVQDAS